MPDPACATPVATSFVDYHLSNKRIVPFKELSKTCCNTTAFWIFYNLYGCKNNFNDSVMHHGARKDAKDEM